MSETLETPEKQKVGMGNGLQNLVHNNHYHCYILTSIFISESEFGDVGLLKLL